MKKKEKIYQELLEFILINKGKIIGGFLGFLFGILFLVIGFWESILILVFTLIGYILGASWEGKIDLRKIINEIFPFHLL